MEWMWRNTHPSPHYTIAKAIVGVGLDLTQTPIHTMFAHFFITRPVFALVISILVVLAGILALTQLPIDQYPDVVPPQVVVTAVYPGADARTVSETVAAPIEEQVNGVEGMLYMESQCTNDGSMQLTITFRLGTNPDLAQVLVQNRVAIATPKLPEEVRRLGVVTKKRSTAILMVVGLTSTKPPTTDQEVFEQQLNLSQHANLRVKDELARIDGVGDVFHFRQPRLFHACLAQPRANERPEPVAQ